MVFEATDFPISSNRTVFVPDVPRSIPNKYFIKATFCDLCRLDCALKAAILSN